MTLCFYSVWFSWKLKCWFPFFQICTVSLWETTLWAAKVYLTWEGDSLLLIMAPQRFGWSRSASWGFLSQACATQLGLFMPSTGLFLFSPAHCGNCRGGSLSIYHKRSLPSELSGGFPAVKSIDQHLKLGPTPLSQLTGYRDLTFFSAHLQHYNRSPPALLATLAFWYNYD